MMLKITNGAVSAIVVIGIFIVSSLIALNLVLLWNNTQDPIYTRDDGYTDTSKSRVEPKNVQDNAINDTYDPQGHVGRNQ